MPILNWWNSYCPLYLNNFLSLTLCVSKHFIQVKFLHPSFPLGKLSYLLNIDRELLLILAVVYTMWSRQNILNRENFKEYLCYKLAGWGGWEDRWLKEYWPSRGKELNSQCSYSSLETWMHAHAPGLYNSRKNHGEESWEDDQGVRQRKRYITSEVQANIRDLHPGLVSDFWTYQAHPSLEIFALADLATWKALLMDLLARFLPIFSRIST